MATSSPVATAPTAVVPYTRARMWFLSVLPLRPPRMPRASASAAAFRPAISTIRLSRQEIHPWEISLHLCTHLSLRSRRGRLARAPGPLRSIMKLNFRSTTVYQGMAFFIPVRSSTEQYGAVQSSMSGTVHTSTLVPIHTKHSTLSTTYIWLRSASINCTA